MIIQTWNETWNKMNFRTTYKRKDQKIKSVNLNKSNESRSEKKSDWKTDIIKKKIYIYDSIDRYKKYLIFRFFELIRETRFISKRFQKLRIGKMLISQKKNLLTKMFYRRKKIMSWNFLKSNKLYSRFLNSLRLKRFRIDWSRRVEYRHPILG